jgi:hypothetical protein
MVVLFGCMNADISGAVAAFREFPNASDDEILDKLLAAGVDRSTASRLVEFLPMAYCRVVLADSGIKFSERFQRKLADGKLSAERELDSDPLWAATLSFAWAEKRSGVGGKSLLAVAAHSAEFDAVNQLANQGTKLNAIVLAPTVFQWQENGPVTTGR